MTSGVPQGSVLPALYCISNQSGLSYHSYTDDTITSTRNRVRDVLGNMENCVAEIKIWMTNKMLKLNDDKTELTD